MAYEAGDPPNSGRPPGFRRAKFGSLALIVLFGTLGTVMFALSEQRSSEREQQIVFDQTARMVADAVRQRADARAAELATAANFVREAGPVEQSVFEGFLAAENQFTAENTSDPGVLLIEPMIRADLEDRLAQERASGNEDFAVTSFAMQADAELLVVTRSVVDAFVQGVRIRGLDITPFRTEMLGPADLPTFGETVNWIEPVDVVSSVSGVEESELDGRDTVTFDITAVLVRPVEPGVPERGWVVRFVNSQQLLGDALQSLPAGVNVRLTVDHIDQAVAAFHTDDTLQAADAAFRAEEFIEFATTGWTVEVVAGEDYLLSTALLDQRFPWVFGLTLTAIAALFDLLIRRNRDRLSTAEFELDHARTLASTDPLTGLVNRQGLIDSSRSTDVSVPATLYFIDLDGFKQVNDLDGHESGDRLLQQVASAISSLFRADDVVARLGGEEFVVFVPGNSNPLLRRAMSERIVAAVSAVDDRVTCSLGVATRDVDEGGDVKTMLRSADVAMYEAKRAGGDRFVLT